MSEMYERGGVAHTKQAIGRRLKRTAWISLLLFGGMGAAGGAAAATGNHVADAIADVAFPATAIFGFAEGFRAVRRCYGLAESDLMTVFRTGINGELEEYPDPNAQKPLRPALRAIGVIGTVGFSPFLTEAGTTLINIPTGNPLVLLV